ncbi:MAG: hypothetical protein FJ117_00125 [Deltaproteobacteria bacterium]|nr:hypothetical protein [Deltaproteobacteria bacterium]
MPDAKYSYLRLGIVLVCCLIMVSVFACAPKAPKERAATLIIEPAKGKAGAMIKIKGSNFLHGEAVEVILTVGDIHHSLGTEKVDEIIADKNGAFEVSSGIPVKTPPGAYKVVATGNKGSVGIFNIEAIK